MRVVAFLQNAWSPVYAGRRWPRDAWLAALHESRSGQRLRTLTAAAGDGVTWWFDNTTEEVGATPSSVCRGDPEHVERVLRRRRPDAVVVLGRQAREIVRGVLRIPLLGAPHPACRVVTNALYEVAGRLVKAGWEGEIELHQSRSGVRVVSLPDGCDCS